MKRQQNQLALRILARTALSWASTVSLIPTTTFLRCHSGECALPLGTKLQHVVGFLGSGCLWGVKKMLP